MITLRAPAKINWFLNVLGMRGDGYHEIQSLLQKITLFDTLTIWHSDDLSLTTETPIPIEGNLAYRAAILLKKRYAVTGGAKMRLFKAIPMGAGLGGGSSDAAAALKGLNKLWALGLDADELCATGEEIGSDVPFFLRSSLSFAEGRGEKIQSCNPKRALPLLLVKPSFSVSTAWVYENLSSNFHSSAMQNGVSYKLTKKDVSDNNIKHFVRIVEDADLSAIARSSESMSNDLEHVTQAQFPVIAEIKKRLSDRGALFALMSGSGPTVFGLFDTLDAAEDAEPSFRDFWTAVVQTMT